MSTSTDPRVRFAAERGRFERIVLVRHAGALTREDAEDVVSDAILDAALDCPADAVDGGRAWFTRVCVNRGHDLRRAREGRPRAVRGGAAPDAAVKRRFVDLDDPVVAASLVSDSRPDEEVERIAEREHARAVVTRALAALDADDAELVRRRYLDEAEPPREEVAAALGVSLSVFEVRATRARRALAAALGTHLDRSVAVA